VPKGGPERTKQAEAEEGYTEEGEEEENEE